MGSSSSRIVLDQESQAGIVTTVKGIGDAITKLRPDMSYFVKFAGVFLLELSSTTVTTETLREIVNENTPPETLRQIYAIAVKQRCVDKLNFLQERIDILPWIYENIKISLDEAPVSLPCLACKEGRIDILDFLFSIPTFDPERQYSGSTLFQRAVFHSQLDVMHYLLGKGVLAEPIGVEFNTARWAFGAKDPNVIDVLYIQGVKFDRIGKRHDNIRAFLRVFGYGVWTDEQLAKKVINVHFLVAVHCFDVIAGNDYRILEKFIPLLGLNNSRDLEELKELLATEVPHLTLDKEDSRTLPVLVRCAATEFLTNYPRVESIPDNSFLSFQRERTTKAHNIIERNVTLGRISPNLLDHYNEPTL